MKYGHYDERKMVADTFATLERARALEFRFNRKKKAAFDAYVREHTVKA